MCPGQLNLSVVHDLLMYMLEILGSGDIGHVHLIRGLRQRAVGRKDTQTYCTCTNTHALKL